MPASDPTHWSGSARLRGGRWGIWFFISALRLLGLRITSALILPVVLYFACVSPDVPAAMAYHRRVFGQASWWKRRWRVLRHFFSFGRAIIERTAILAGNSRRFSFSFDGEEHLRRAVAEGRGVLLLTAHVGNWEAAGHLLSRIDVPINVTGFDRETPEIRALLNQASQAKFKLIPLTGSPTDAIPLVAALHRGEVVAMLGDRAYGSAAARVPFLGGTAAFPVGPYMIAASAGAPLIHVFNLREPGAHYRFFGFAPQRPEIPSRRLRNAYLKECATRFAFDLEGILKRDPYQWYNFFPFWEPNENGSDRSASEPEQNSAHPSLHPDPAAIRR